MSLAALLTARPSTLRLKVMSVSLVHRRLTLCGAIATTAGSQDPRTFWTADGPTFDRRWRQVVELRVPRREASAGRSTHLRWLQSAALTTAAQATNHRRRGIHRPGHCIRGHGQYLGMAANRALSSRLGWQQANGTSAAAHVGHLECSWRLHLIMRERTALVLSIAGP